MPIFEGVNIKKLLPEVKTNIPLKNHTTFRIGGQAKYFFVAKNKKEIIKAILVAKKNHLPFFILGGGSNLLVSDKGYNGLVIKIQNSLKESRFQWEPTGQAPKEASLGNPTGQAKFKTIYIESGVRLSDLVRLSLEKNLTGLGWAAGIPGTVGGAIYGNTGAFGKSIADFIKEVTVLEIKNSKPKIKNFSKKNCHFSYKNSIFKQKKNLVILSAKFRLEKGNKFEIKKRIKEYLDYRKRHHPLTFPSAGCIFKNPKLKIENQKLFKNFPKLKEFNKRGEIPASWLIEESNLKGKRIGQAQISKKHANFIVNLEQAKATDVKKLIKLIKGKVKSKFGMVLKEEIQYVGF